MFALPVDGLLAGDVRGDRLDQKLIVVARPAAAVGDLHELRFRPLHVTLLQISLAEIFAHLGVAGIDRQRLVVIADALVDIAELARGVADGAEHPRLLPVLDAEEELQRLCIVRLLAELAPGNVEVVIGQRRRIAVDARSNAATPDLPGSATRADAAVLLLAISFAAGAAFAGFRAAAIVRILDGKGPRHSQGKPEQNCPGALRRHKSNRPGHGSASFNLQLSQTTASMPCRLRA